jgi:hypothetical protein
MDMDDLFGLFSRRSGLSSSVASIGLSLVSKFLLRNAEPQRASGLMSMLPSSITKMYLKTKLLIKFLENVVMAIEKREE